MVTNDLKKGTKVQLRNGWFATIEDNMKGVTRLCKVEGDFTELGSVYSHDILTYRDADGVFRSVEHTPAQQKLRKTVAAMGF